MTPDPPDPTVVELVVDAGPVATDDAGGSPSGRPPRHRALAALVAVGAAGAVAFVAFGSGDDEDAADDGADAAATSVAADITVPETLPPVPTTPEPVANDPLSERPTNWPLINVDATIDLDDTLTMLAGEPFASSQTFVEQPGFAQRVDIATSDGDRPTPSYSISVETVGVQERVVIVGDDGYVRRSDDRWETFETTDRVRALWRRLLVGPLDAVTAGSPDTPGTRPVVAIERADGSGRIPARAVRIDTTVADLRRWAPYALGPLAESMEVDGDHPVELLVAVAIDGRLIEYRWTIPFGSGEQSVVHRLAAGDPIEIAAPPPDHVDGPATGWIIAPR